MGTGRGESLSPLRRVLLAAQRSLVIYFLGLLLDAATSSQLLFFKWNILQMIAAAYFIGTCLSMLPFVLQAAFVTLVLLVKWYILSVMDHPEHGSSVWYFAVDGAVVDDRYAAGAIPVNGEQLLKSRILALESSLPLTGSVNFSPLLNWLCNVFNVLPAAAVCVLGVWTGRFIRSDKSRSPRTGWVLVAVGCAAWLTSWLWNLQHPWSKDFFTASYAVLAAGTGAGLLGLFYLLLDADPRLMHRVAFLTTVFGMPAGVVSLALDAPASVQNWLCGIGAGGVICWLLQSSGVTLRFFRAFGLNAIAIYFVNEMLFKMVFTKWSMPLFEPDNTIIGALYGWLRDDRIAGTQLDTIVGSWAFAVVWLLGCWLFVRHLDRRGLYIRV